MRLHTKFMPACAGAAVSAISLVGIPAANGLQNAFLTLALTRGAMAWGTALFSSCVTWCKKFSREALHTATVIYVSHPYYGRTGHAQKA